MKKPARIILFVVSALGLLVVAFIVFVSTAKIPTYEVDFPDISVELTPERVAEGARIASVLCIQCHASTDGKLGGAYMADAQSFGEVYASNITQHPEFGIGEYTDGELAYLIRSGVRRDGQYIMPWMPKFAHLSDEDLYSIIAFLRSDHPLVQPSAMEQPEPVPSFFAKFLLRTGLEPLPYPEGPIYAPDPSDRVAYGRYLAVGKFDCFGCHSASFAKLDLMDPENSQGYFGGGSVMYDREMNKILTSNLTMDEETGLGSWTEEDFIMALRYGRRPDNSAIRFPMMPAPLITEEEAAAIWTYLQTVPVIHNPIER
jgi:mono/diheme cytochrome c family protein